MRVASEALEAWWPPTFTPPLLGRMWLAWWIIQEDSQRTFFSSASSICRWSDSSGRDGIGTSLSAAKAAVLSLRQWVGRSEEHTSELQSLMRISYAVFSLKQQITIKRQPSSDSNRVVQPYHKFNLSLRYRPS